MSKIYSRMEEAIEAAFMLLLVSVAWVLIQVFRYWLEYSWRTVVWSARKWATFLTWVGKSWIRTIMFLAIITIVGIH